jgi:3-oxoacyl-[acyl-carrier-protein] synthase II
VSTLRTQLGAEILDFAPQNFVANRKVLRKMTRTDQFALVGATLAVRNSGLKIAEQDGERVGLYAGSNKEVSDLMYMREALLARAGQDGRADFQRFGASSGAIYPLFYVEGLQAASLFFISEAYGIKGANTYFAGTAEIGATAIGSAYRALRRGEVDVAVAGGYDDAVSWWHMTKMDALGLMTDRNDLGAGGLPPLRPGPDGDGDG